MARDTHDPKIEKGDIYRAMRQYVANHGGEMRPPVMEQICSWIVVGAIAILAVGTGIAFMTTSLPHHVFVADGCFILAAIMLYVRFVTWEDMRFQKSSKFIFILVAIVTVAITIGLVWLNHSWNTPH